MAKRYRPNLTHEERVRRALLPGFRGKKPKLSSIAKQLTSGRTTIPARQR